ncbi:MAG: ion transporter [Opitutales bacterium]|nr:ion transporter [Opitutales bacterium]
MNPGKAEDFNRFDLVILVLSVFVLGALAIEVMLDLSPETVKVLNRIDFAVCMVFLADFFWRLYRAPDKKAFMKWGWIDLLASIPVVNELRWARIIRVLRILRILRAFRSGKTLISYIFHRKGQSALSIGLLTGCLALFSGAVLILEVEAGHPDANILNANDAIWWSMVTVTTVGYGDFYPVTLEGRIIASALMVVGIGLFGTLSGAMASILLSGSNEEQDERLERLDRMAREVLNKIEVRDWNTADPPPRARQGKPKGPPESSGESD